jgi:hypothetical protein
VLPWTCGDFLEVKLFASVRSFPYFGTTDVEKATCHASDSFALFALFESAEMTPTPAEEDAFDGTPQVVWSDVSKCGVWRELAMFAFVYNFDRVVKGGTGLRQDVQSSSVSSTCYVRC